MSSLNIKFTPQKKRKKSTIQIHKIKRWVIVAVTLNLVVIGIHSFFMLGGNWVSVRSQWDKVFPENIEVTDSIVAPFIPVSSYYLGHSYPTDSLMDTVNFQKHLAHYSVKLKDSTTGNMAAIYGIDVSRWQSKINWDDVKLDTAPHPLQVVIMKATQGDSIVDPYFEYNWKQAKTKFIVGIYHFYEYQATPDAQAENLIHTVSLSSGNLRPVIDIELACASCNKPGVSKTKMIRDLKLFLAKIESHYQVQPILYTYTYFYDSYLLKHFSDYTFWMAQYAINPPPGMRITETDSTAQPPDVAMWQFSSKGRINGIIGNVDLNFIPSYELKSLLIQ